MSAYLATQTQPEVKLTYSPVGGGLFQRSCACGQHTASSNGECEHCKKKHQDLLEHRALLAPRLRDAQSRSLDSTTGPSGGLNFSHDFSHVGIHSQAKRLALSQPGDPYEREADRVAEQVLSPHPFSSRRLEPLVTAHLSFLPPLVQRQLELNESDDDETDIAQESEDLIGDEDEEEIVADDSGMPKRENDTIGVSSPQTAELKLANDAGYPLDTMTRRFMEQQIGFDFSRVRVHTDSQAIESARQLQAHAYTMGSDIYFNAGRYEPSDTAGLQLLAHELTHVVQQTLGSTTAHNQIQRQKKRSSTKRRRRRRPRSACTGACAPSRSNVHDGCTTGSVAAGVPYISDLTVQRGAHRIFATWSSGRTSTWDCSPSTSSGPDGKEPTPIVDNDTVGIKCDKCHTNRHGDGMGWFTGFASQGRRIGFHNSQRVGPNYESHGCVRVSCSIARRIHDNTTTGVTTINVMP